MRTTIFLLSGMAKLLRFSVVYYEILTKSCEEFSYGVHCTVIFHKRSLDAAVSVEYQYFVLLYSINVVLTISYIIVFSEPITMTPSFQPSLIFNQLWLECVTLLSLKH